MQKVNIYTLSDPETNEIRYVGQTVKSLNNRLSSHIWDCKRVKNHRTNWIKSILNRNLRPKINLLEECTVLDYIEKEKYWISQLKSLGYNLVNGTNGGEGMLGNKKSKETIEKLKKSLCKKPIVQYDLEGNKINEYNSTKEIAIIFKKINGTKITACCKLKRKQTYGFQWRYKSENIEKLSKYSKKSLKDKKLTIKHRNKVIKNLKGYNKNWIKK